MTDTNARAEADRQLLVAAQQKGRFATLLAFLRLSGPGWLQSAITLGGGSLASSLYLGVLAGFALLWVQPLFMVLGIVMLCAIGYVTMSTGERPFDAINRHVNPVLGWSWALAALAANMVWCLPQFSLANSVLQQNLLPHAVGAASPLGEFWGKVVISASILIVCVLITWSYGSGHWGIKLYEWMLKLMVGVIVVCFVLVVYTMTRSGRLPWGEIALGFLPDPRSVLNPASGFREYIAPMPENLAKFWNDEIKSIQIDRIAAAAATAVGINMTFLFPYSMLRKGWTKEFRGLQVFDLSTGMFIPFVLATSCVVIAAGAQFHAKPVPGLVADDADDRGVSQQPTGKERADYRNLLAKRVKAEIGDEAYAKLVSGEEEFAKVAKALGPEMLAAMTPAERDEQKIRLGAAALHARIEQLPHDDRLLGAMLVERDSNRLAQALSPLTANSAASTDGSRPIGGAADLLFGIGVVGMTLSTITLLMLISGFVICEIFKIPQTGWGFRLACLPAGVGALGPFIWSRAGFALAIPTSIFGLMLLPIAYLSFLLLMNQKSLLRENMPRGGRRIAWNVLMTIATGVAIVASGYIVWAKTRMVGVIFVGVLLGLAVLVQLWRLARRGRTSRDVTSGTDFSEPV